MNGYELSRDFFDFCFENPEKVKPNHIALYFFAIEHCNRLGWKQKFGLPTEMAKAAIGIHSYGTYSKTLNDLIDWGFIILVTKSANQYSSNIVALSKFDKALDKALDKAMIKHASKHETGTHQSIDSIDKHITSKPLNKETKNKPAKAVSISAFLSDLPELERSLCERFIKHRNLIKRPVKSHIGLQRFLSDINKVTKDKALWPAVLDKYEQTEWQSVEYVKLEDTTPKESIHIAYEYALCMAGADNQKDRRWFLKEIMKYPAEFIGVLAWYWRNGEPGEIKRIIAQHLIEEYADKKGYRRNYAKKTHEEHIAYWTEKVEKMRNEQKQ